ncbi:putative metal-binding motif-containing protein [Corallococcus sp. Z5C101001]|uniref:putative metal-binding motif-containing protein n=1 Tax=Corallococcus sp. Z5C101001 TaxID=2596829 RepID=UPI00117FCF4E|nr:putative metal-binding motif-containing protein [Corallococcus sp. Z5C101001]TSC31813.1 hypothetical protein FOF48_14335 [Corallococcus sp. Z5C101001]
MPRLPLLWVSMLALLQVHCTVPSLEDLWREQVFCPVGAEDCGMLRIQVEARGFVPGCLEIVAKDAASKETRAVTVPYRGTPLAGKTLTQGFSPPKAWSLEVAVSVQAFEHECMGTGVITKVREFVLSEGKTSDVEFTLEATDADGDGYVSTGTGGTDCDDEVAEVHPGAPERCNYTDDDCDGEQDEGLGLAQACVSEAGCTGFTVCGGAGEVTCFTSPMQSAWADEDGDGHGDGARGPLLVCAGPLPPNRLVMFAPHDDCDDTHPGVHPGAQELCNGRDDNCTGGIDEGFNVGTACTEDKEGCPGVTRCDASGNGVECDAPRAAAWYPDEDSDSFGRTDAGVVSCLQPDAGFVRQGGDCDDGNPFTHPGAPEICDEQDNDCDGLTDQGTCMGAPGWSARSVGGGDWYAMGLWGSGGVWIVGSDSSRAWMQPGAGGFTFTPGKCSLDATPRTLASVWVHPQTGTAYIGGTDGLLTVQTPTSTSCAPFAPPSASGSTLGLKGFAGVDGGVVIFGVASLSNGASGGTFEWDGGSVTVPVQSYLNRPMAGVDGVSPDLLFAVGTGGGRGHILRGGAGKALWVSETGVPDAGGLNAIDVVTPRLAYAVGDNGTFLTWNGSAWRSSAAGPGTVDRLTGVLAFGANSIYVTSEEGRLYRYNGRSWSSSSLGVSLYAIDGSRPDDVWVVGRFGQVFHYPSWPR